MCYRVEKQEMFPSSKTFFQTLQFSPWSWVYKVHMPQFSAFEVCVENLCCIPWCPSSHWEPGLCMCDLKCHTPPPPRDRTEPGGQGVWCQSQVPGGHCLNNASCSALWLAGATLWCVPETSVAWVFNHLACSPPTSYQSVSSPSWLTSHSPKQINETAWVWVSVLMFTILYLCLLAYRLSLRNILVIKWCSVEYLSIVSTSSVTEHSVKKSRSLPLGQDNG